jgi:hypothetical protein
MKKARLIIGLLFMNIFTFMNAATFTGGQVFYLKPNSDWLNDGARFAVYVFRGNTNAWASMTKIKSGYYRVEAPSGTWDNLIFCRMNGGTSTNSWSNKWNQTGDLTYDGTKNFFNKPNNNWDGYGNAGWQASSLNITDTNLSNASDLSGNSLNALATVSVTNSVSSVSNMEKLGNAVGNSGVISALNISGTIPTNWASDYFSSVTSSNLAITVNSALSVNDNEAINLPRKVTIGNSNSITFTRTFDTTGKRQTLFIPLGYDGASITATGLGDFDVEKYTGATVDGDNISFNFETVTDPVNDLEANVPYIVKVKDGVTTNGTVTFTSTAVKTITTSEQSAGVVGNYGTGTLSTTGRNIYILNASDQFVKITQTLNLVPYRAYFDADNVPGASQAPKLTLLHNGEEGTSGIDVAKQNKIVIRGTKQGMIIESTINKEVSIYDVLGRKVKTLVLEAGMNEICHINSGIYIVEGNKVIVK